MHIIVVSQKRDNILNIYFDLVEKFFTALKMSPATSLGISNVAKWPPLSKLVMPTRFGYFQRKMKSGW